ncbi:MAG TPA: AI-2E family transporter [Thermoanaerobaculia bacterium]|nr:AI-2E family transporter [Thermoanaerobaculia bacterium]
MRGAIHARSFATTGLFLIALVAALRFARELFLPVVLAVMLKFLLDPVARALERLRVPAAISSLLVVAGALCALALVLVRIYEPAQVWLWELPETLRRAELKMGDVREPVDAVAEVARQVDEIAGDDGNDAKPSVEMKGASLSESFFAGMRALAAAAAVTVALLYFLLASGDLFLRKVVAVLSRLRDKKRAVEIARQVERDVSTYLFTITLINVGLGAAVTLAMHWLDMPTPMLWGAMAASFNFVPYLGAAVGIAAIAVASFLNFDQLGQMVAPPLVYLGLTTFEGTLVTPMILGQRLALNPVAVFLGLFFWGWLWGIPGALLAVPMMVVLKIVCDRVPHLGAVGEFMGR